MKHQPYYQIQRIPHWNSRRWIIDDVNDVIHNMAEDQFLPLWMTFVAVQS